MAFLLSVGSLICKAQVSVQLAPPLLKYESIFFKNSTNVELKFAQQGAQIYYTVNSNPPTQNDKLYSKPVQITKTFTTLKAIAARTGFLPSEMVSATFIKDGLKIQSVQHTAANERFRGSGINTLIDNEGGITNMNAGTWVGFQQDSVEVDIRLVHSQKIAAVVLNFLLDPGSWIFLPAQIHIFYFDDSRQSFQLMTDQVIVPDKQINGPICQPVKLDAVKKIITEKVKIILTGIRSLPEWHPGKGQHGWIFIDEIKVY